MIRILSSVFALMLLAACQVSPTHPSLQGVELSKLLPVRTFVASTGYNDNYRLSPDGSKMVHQGVSQLRPAIIIEDLTGNVPQRALRFRNNSPNPFWAADGKHLLFHKDGVGRENFHVFAVDVNDPTLKQRDLTPFDGTRAFVVRVPQRTSDSIFIMHNARDNAVFDLYEVNVATGEQTMIFQNDGGIESLLIDDEGNLKARVKRRGKRHTLEILNAKKEWQVILDADIFDVAYPVNIDSAGESLYAISNINSDKTQLLNIDLKTGKQTVLFSDDNFDLNNVELSAQDNRPLFVKVEADYPTMHYFDDKIKGALEDFAEYGKYGVRVMSMTRAEDAMTLVRYNSKGAGFYYYNFETGEQRLLNEAAENKNEAVLTSMKPITISANDGLSLRGYVSLPNNSSGKYLPTVLLVHGGPWVRDTWQYDTATQFLNNRGYAVLRINYRGSSGYGKQHLFAAEKEFAGKMHQDLIDTIDWAIAQGISDPERIAIMGRSYGGYATLVGMTMTPERFACGIDIVGVADLATLLENAPPYWRNSMHMWDRMVGDPENPADRKDMDSRSPLNFAKNVENPILIMHGVNDPRVSVDQSERMVSELKKYGKSVKYIPFKGEGHSFNHWKTNLKIYRETEDFLASCLGGRSAGFDYYSLGSWAF